MGICLTLIKDLLAYLHVWGPHIIIFIIFFIFHTTANWGQEILQTLSRDKTAMGNLFLQFFTPLPSQRLFLNISKCFCFMKVIEQRIADRRQYVEGVWRWNIHWFGRSSKYSASYRLNVFQLKYDANTLNFFYKKCSFQTIWSYD